MKEVCVHVCMHSCADIGKAENSLASLEREVSLKEEKDGMALL